MGKSVKVKGEAEKVPVPQTREAVVEAISLIGHLQRERTVIEAEMNERLAAIKEEYEKKAGPMAEEIRELHRGVQVWCEANRAALTEGGRIKTCALASGEISWRLRPPRVAVKAVDFVIDLLESKGLARLVRLKKEINKEAILADPDAIAGVKGLSITQGEDFVIKPFESELESVM
ncbi:MAG: host-nuclease inhibitor Gam family protein [Magnetococcales bacterium]|nr:host-nuclease inhibitor Gam family protein [Magnetococcales bacterium]